MSEQGAGGDDDGAGGDPHAYRDALAAARERIACLEEAPERHARAGERQAHEAKLAQAKLARRLEVLAKGASGNRDWVARQIVYFGTIVAGMAISGAVTARDGTPHGLRFIVFLCSVAAATGAAATLAIGHLQRARARKRLRELDEEPPPREASVVRIAPHDLVEAHVRIAELEAELAFDASTENVEASAERRSPQPSWRETSTPGADCPTPGEHADARALFVDIDQRVCRLGRIEAGRRRALYDFAERVGPRERKTVASSTSERGSAAFMVVCNAECDVERPFGLLGSRRAEVRRRDREDAVRLPRSHCSGDICTEPRNHVRRTRSRGRILHVERHRIHLGTRAASSSRAS